MALLATSALVALVAAICACYLPVENQPMKPFRFNFVAHNRPGQPGERARVRRGG